MTLAESPRQWSRSEVEATDRARRTTSGEIVPARPRPARSSRRPGPDHSPRGRHTMDGLKRAPAVESSFTARTRRARAIPPPPVSHASSEGVGPADSFDGIRPDVFTSTTSASRSRSISLAIGIDVSASRLPRYANTRRQLAATDAAPRQRDTSRPERLRRIGNAAHRCRPIP